MSLTLWGETAKRFDGSNQPVIAVKGAGVCFCTFLFFFLDYDQNLLFFAQVSSFNGCSLSGGDLMIDPDIEACHELRCPCPFFIDFF